MGPRARKLALTTHVTSSVGWLGAVTGFLALAVAGLVSEDAVFIRSVYPALELLAWVVILPLGVASFLTGLIQSLGTKWGLFRHYWVLAKLFINVVATVILLLYMQSVGYLANVAAQASFSASDQRELRTQAIVHAGAALVVLLMATALSVYKPRGLTRYGRRKQLEERPLPQS